MFNKRGQSEGFSWFFAIIVIAFILLIFYLSVSFTGLLSKSPTANIVLGDFNSVKNLAAYSFFYDNLKFSIYNIDEKVISDKFFNFLSVYYFDKNKDCYGFRIGNFYLGKSSLGASTEFYERPVGAAANSPLGINSLSPGAGTPYVNDAGGYANSGSKLTDSFEPGDSSVSVLTNKGFTLSGIKVGGCDE